MLYRDINIKELYQAILNDEYMEEEQKDNMNIELYEPSGLVEFINRNIYGNNVLEIGCGTGKSFEVFPITYAIEPCKKRYEIAVENIYGVEVRQGVVECIPFNNIDTVLCIGTWNQIRSDYEALIEVNNSLNDNGIFIFDIWSDDVDLVVGRSYGPRNYIRMVKDFGFELVEVREFSFFSKWRQSMATRYGIAVRKVHQFDYHYLMKPQVTSKDRIRNFHPNRDADLL